MSENRSGSEVCGVFEKIKEAYRRALAVFGADASSKHLKEMSSKEQEETTQKTKSTEIDYTLDSDHIEGNYSSAEEVHARKAWDRAARNRRR